MVRKQTWILLVIFALLLGVVFYLQKNPLPKSSSATPSATPEKLMIPDLSSSDIVWVELKDNDKGSDLQVSQDAPGTWTLGPDKKLPVQAGTAEQLRSDITAIKVITTVPLGYALNAMGLEKPAQVITLRTTGGTQYVISVGDHTPTGSGYYIKVDNQAAIVVSNDSINSIISLIEGIPPTPTPGPATTTPEGTPSPSTTPTP